MLFAIPWTDSAVLVRVEQGTERQVPVAYGVFTNLVGVVSRTSAQERVRLRINLPHRTKPPFSFGLDAFDELIRRAT